MRSLSFRAAILCIASAVSGIAWGQTSNGTIAGSITDPSGGAVSKATVSALSAQYGAPHQTHTDSAGTFRLESLEPGTYTVTVTAPGFSVLSISDVIVNGSLTTSANGKLELGTVRQTVEVVAPAAQAIDTQSGQLGATLEQAEVREFPYLSLNGAELATTLAGVHDAPQGNPITYSRGAVATQYTNGFEFSVNGSRPRANNFLIDGQDDNDYQVAGQAYQPTNWGAIQEVTILTNSYSAEYGRGGGSVTNYIYKSGANTFHGNLWEINRNSALAAIPTQDAMANPISKNPYDNENTFGFDFGGPVKRDKVFFFGTAQWDRERQLAFGPNGLNLPTAAGIATLKSLLPNPNISLFLNAIGSLESMAVSPNTSNVPLGPGRPSVEVGVFQLQNIPTSGNFVDWNYRMDWQLTGRDLLTGSVIRDTGATSPNTSSDAGALPSFETQISSTSEIFRGQWVHTLSSSLVNELRLSNVRTNFQFGLTPATAAGPLANLPYIQFGVDPNTPQLAAIGVNSNFPQGRTHKTWQVQEALSRSAGKHTIKAGADITILSLEDTLPLNTRGSIFYNSSLNPGYSPLANFIDDYTGVNPGGISKVFGNRDINSDTTMFAPYMQDTWRIKNNLTLDFGLRYEYWGALANSLAYPAFNVAVGFGARSATYPNMYAYKQIPDKRNFAPRVGLAYTPHWGRFITGEGKATIRAGYGIFYDGLFSNIIDQSAESEPNALGGSEFPSTGRGIANASTTGISSIMPFADPTLMIFSMASNLHNPLTQQWNVNVERELPLGLVLTLAYVGTRGTHLFANQDFNPQVGFSPTNPNFGEIAVRTNAGDSRYDSAQVEVDRRIRSGLVLRAAYTYSKFMDDTSEIFTTTGTSSYSQDLTNQRSDWGPSAFDQRHRFTVAYVWKTPYFHNEGILRALTDDWEWSGIATVESGTPNTVAVGFDNIGNGHPNSRPDLANPSAPLDSLGIDGGNAFSAFSSEPFSSGMYYDFRCWLNDVSGATTVCSPEPYSTFHFVVPANIPGNAQRNSVFGPGQVYFDTAIQRDFPIHVGKLENQTLSFRTEFFNAFNHPNLFTPTYTMTDPNYNNTGVTISGGRQIRFWLKYSF